MLRHWLAGAATLALSTTVASAQVTSSETTIITRPVPAPTQSYSETRSQRTIDANGVETRESQHIEKSESVGNGPGTLSAESHTRTTGETTVVTPPVSTYRSTTTTTTTK